MTVAQLRKALKGVSGDLKVYTRDHDHGTYETNGLANNALVLNQEDMSELERKGFEDCFVIGGDYFVVSV